MLIFVWPASFMCFACCVWKVSLLHELEIKEQTTVGYMAPGGGPWASLGASKETFHSNNGGACIMSHSHGVREAADVKPDVTIVDERRRIKRGWQTMVMLAMQCLLRIHLFQKKTKIMSDPDQIITLNNTEDCFFLNFIYCKQSNIPIETSPGLRCANWNTFKLNKC